MKSLSEMINKIKEKTYHFSYDAKQTNNDDVDNTDILKEILLTLLSNQVEPKNIFRYCSSTLLFKSDKPNIIYEIVESIEKIEKKFDIELLFVISEATNIKHSNNDMTSTLQELINDIIKALK